MAKPYYLCAYGHTLRISDRVSSEDEATEGTFGIKNGRYPAQSRVTLLRMEGKGWAYRTDKEKRAKIIEVARLHKKRTGSVLSGCEKETADVQGPEAK